MPDNESPELIPRLHYSKSWEDPADYATHQHSEIQNRRDMQSLFTEIAAYLNNVMIPRAEQLLAGGGGGTGTGGGVSGDYLPLDGGTMRGPLVLHREPVVDAEAVTKHYADALAGGIRTDMNGNFTAINQRADGIELLAQNNEGNIASLNIRADEISSSVANVDGRVSTLEQTADGFETRVTNAEGDISTISQKVDGITLSVSTVTENGEVFARLTLKIGENELYGYIKLEGNVDVSGQLSAEALYAPYGEIANLAVDQLVTTRRIVKFLDGDQSDDNFIRAYQQNMEWVTGNCTGGTIQAKNPNGEPLYWPVNVSGLSRGADGYPVNEQNERIFTTTTPTSYPVQVYTYEEAVKRSISFEAVNGIYSPVDRFGAGNQQGNNKAWILKTADGFDIRYLTPDNQEIGIRMTTDGKVYIDGFEVPGNDILDTLADMLNGENAAENYDRLLGLLKPVTIDFSRLSETSFVDPDYTVATTDYTDPDAVPSGTSNVSRGSFSETLRNGAFNAYVVERDSSGRIAKITDTQQHETVVLWGDES